jgi:hypothetical protein
MAEDIDSSSAAANGAVVHNIRAGSTYVATAEVCGRTATAKTVADG